MAVIGVVMVTVIIPDDNTHSMTPPSKINCVPWFCYTAAGEPSGPSGPAITSSPGPPVGPTTDYTRTGSPGPPFTVTGANVSSSC